MEITFKNIEQKIQHYKHLCYRVLTENVFNIRDKREVIRIISQEQILPISNFQKFPPSLDKFVSMEMGNMFDKNQTLTFDYLIETFFDFIDSYADDYFEDEFSEFKGLSKEATKNKVIDETYNFMIDNKISGAINDW